MKEYPEDVFKEFVPIQLLIAFADNERLLYELYKRSAETGSIGTHMRFQWLRRRLLQSKRMEFERTTLDQDARSFDDRLEDVRARRQGCDPYVRRFGGLDIIAQSDRISLDPEKDSCLFQDFRKPKAGRKRNIRMQIDSSQVCRCPNCGQVLDNR